MRVTRKDVRLVPFGNLLHGKVFSIPGNLYGYVFMKIYPISSSKEDTCAICLNTGVRTHVRTEQEVELLKAELIVEPYPYPESV